MPKSTHPPIIPGTRFGQLVAVERCGATALGKALWLFRCDCGTNHIVRATTVRSGVTRSCGCLRAEPGANQRHTVPNPAGSENSNFRHGKTKTPEYSAWVNLNRRCYDTDSTSYKYYGLRGIAVCERWRSSFMAFLEDMGPRPTTAHSVERRDNDGNYEPSNCCWATKAEQIRNRRKPVRGRFTGGGQKAA